MPIEDNERKSLECSTLSNTFVASNVVQYTVLCLATWYETVSLTSIEQIFAYMYCQYSCHTEKSLPDLVNLFKHSDRGKPLEN